MERRSILINIIERGLTFGQVIDRILVNNTLRAYCEFDEETHVFVNSEGYLCWGGLGQDGNQVNLYMIDNDDDCFRKQWTLFKKIEKAENKNIIININCDFTDNVDVDNVINKLIEQLKIIR